jgi:hypothetical protein
LYLETEFQKQPRFSGQPELRAWEERESQILKAKVQELILARKG